MPSTIMARVTELGVTIKLHDQVRITHAPFTTGVTNTCVTTELYDTTRKCAKPMLLVTELDVAAVQSS